MMRNHKSLSVALAALLFFSSALPTFAESIEDKKAELESLQQQIDKKSNERENKKHEVASAIDLLIAAQKELAAAKEELATVQGQQDALKLQIVKNEDDIDKKTVELNGTKKVYSHRLRDIYMNGQVDYLDVLLGAKDFPDFSSRMYLLQKVIARDINLLNSLRTQKEELEKEKNTLDDNKKELDKVAKVVEDKKLVVEKKTAERQSIYQKALAEQEKLDAEYNELMEASKNITNMIRSMEQGGRMGSVHGSGQFIWPASGPITSPFGWRTHPIFGTQRLHSGMDIGADYGDTIVAADSGTVIYSGWMGGYGNVVMIDHGGGLVTVYGHNSELLVGQGQNVSQGQPIASCGSTGNSTGPHCHFEVRSHGEVTDPMAYLP